MTVILSGSGLGTVPCRIAESASNRLAPACCEACLPAVSRQADKGANRPGVSRRGGFSLVELLLVIALISMLLTIAVPSLTRAKEMARRSVCTHNLRRLALGMESYAAKYDSCLPPDRVPYTRDGKVYKNKYGRQKPHWQWFLEEGDSAVITRANYPDGAVGEAEFQAATTMSNDYFTCPTLNSAKANDIRDGAYGFNHAYLGCGRPKEYVPDTRYQPLNWPVSVDRVHNTSRTVILADSRGAIADQQMNVREHSYTLDPPLLAASKGAAEFGPENDPDDPLQDSSIPDKWKNSPADSRHLDQANVAFMDGHIQPMSMEGLGYKVDGDGIIVKNDGYTEANHVPNELWTGTESGAP